MNAYYIIICIITAAYTLLNFKHDIQMLQQNSYRLERYWRWLKGDMGSTSRLVDVAVLFLLCSTLVPVWFGALIVTLVALAKIFIIARKKFKKPLVFTRRVIRIYTVTGVLALLLGGLPALCWTSGGESVYTLPQAILSVLLITAILSWLPVMAAVVLLMPVEKMINRRYYKDAERILRSNPDLKVVGITGSYGKTSTKHYLERILSEQYNVLMTPGSYNTTMGVIRTVRELMKPYTEIFICEMGAKQRGDIKEICDLVHPSVGIVTAVGPMHLETFGSIDNVQATKFELVDALPSDGLAVINNDFAPCAARKVDNVEACRYSTADAASDVEYRATDIDYSPDGTTFTVAGPDGLSLTLSTRLVGECNISNLMAAVIVALYLGVPEEKIRYAVGCIEQVEHRLNVKRTPGGVTIIDDAFNSNPTGSRMAVDVLKSFRGGKRIIVTPGMIELGERQFDLNRELGEHIGGNVDVAVVVGNYNREALSKGIEKTAGEVTALHIVDSFNDAQKLLSGMLAPGDTVLYENDLPDTFK